MVTLVTVSVLVKFAVIVSPALAKVVLRALLEASVLMAMTGAMVSTLKLAAAEVPVLPAASVCATVMD